MDENKGLMVPSPNSKRSQECWEELQGQHICQACRDPMDHNDEDADEATGPRAYGKKHKASL